MFISMEPTFYVFPLSKQNNQNDFLNQFRHHTQNGDICHVGGCHTRRRNFVTNK